MQSLKNAIFLFCNKSVLFGCVLYFCHLESKERMRGHTRRWHPQPCTHARQLASVSRVLLLNARACSGNLQNGCGRRKSRQMWKRSVICFMNAKISSAYRNLYANTESFSLNQGALSPTPDSIYSYTSIKKKIIGINLYT